MHPVVIKTNSGNLMIETRHNTFIRLSATDILGIDLTTEEVQYLISILEIKLKEIMRY